MGLGTRSSRLLSAGALGVLLGSACGGRGADAEGPPAGPGGGWPGGGGQTSGDGSSGDGDGDGAERLDVGSNGGSGGGSGGGETSAAGCEKIDFLFIVDSSGSMEDEQQNLVNSFPEFIDTIQTATEVADYRIMVLDTDDCDPAQGAGRDIMCTAEFPDCCPSQCATFPGGSCDGVACSCPPAPDACHHQLGAGRITDREGQPCGIEGGARYISETQSDLAGTFGCLATVGIQGSGDERPMGALTAAISPAMLGAGGCNEGFLREDALLVVTLITDEEDDHEAATGFGSAGEPAQWFDAVVAAKQTQRNAAILSLVGPPAPEACPALDKSAPRAVDGAEVATRVIQFTEMFDFGFVGPVCADSYKPFFDEAVGVVDQACDEFVPPG